MHEFSLVQSLLAQSAELMHAHDGVAIEAIHVELGPLSGVEPTLVALAFEQLVESSECRGAQLQIDETPLGCQCEACTHRFDMVDFRFVCPECQSQNIRIVRGDEFRIVDVTIRTREPLDLDLVQS